MGNIIYFNDIEKKPGVATFERMQRAYNVWNSAKTANYVQVNQDTIPGIESITHYTKAQHYAVEALRQATSGFKRLYRVKLPANFEQIIQDPHGKLDCRTYHKIVSIPTRKKDELAYRLVCAVHDGWVHDHSRIFFEQEYTFRRFFFLRSELCGIFIFKDHLESISPFLNRIHLITSIDNASLISVYTAKRREFIRSRGLTNENLVDYVANAGKDYSYLAPKISNALKCDRALAQSIADTIIKIAPLGNINKY